MEPKTRSSGHGSRLFRASFNNGKADRSRSGPNGVRRVDGHPRNENSAAAWEATWEAPDKRDSDRNAIRSVIFGAWVHSRNDPRPARHPEYRQDRNRFSLTFPLSTESVDNSVERVVDLRHDATDGLVLRRLAYKIGSLAKPLIRLKSRWLGSRSRGF
jgi:hypothetical protein